jgi:AcrR family transcriptional regulator
MCPVQTPRKPGRPKDPGLETRRKAEILDAAARTFAANGFAATDVQVIADRLGVGKGTVYRYFPTKEALFLAAVEAGLRELDAEIGAHFDTPGLDPIELIRRVVRAYLEFFRRRPEMAELFIQERAAFRDHHRPLYFATKDDEAKACQRGDLLARLIAEGRVRPMPPERVFAVIGDLLYGTILTNLLTGRPADPAAQAADVLDVVFNGLLTTAERKRQVRRKAKKGAKR